jgi:peptidoglycan/LPS O-acetylase OafA/YrhL
MRTARQQNGELGFETINLIHWPVGLLAMALLPIIVFGLRGQPFRECRELAAVIAIAILGNAVICGALSNPHDRYGARVVWLAVFAVIMTAARLIDARRRATLLGARTKVI